jgi:hypothetical protein
MPANAARRPWLLLFVFSAGLASCGTPVPSSRTDDAASSPAGMASPVAGPSPAVASSSESALPQAAATSAEAPPAPGSACQLDGSKPAEVSIVALARALQGLALKQRPSETKTDFEDRAEKTLANAKQIPGRGTFQFTVAVPPDQVVVDATTGALTVNPAHVSGGLVPTTLGNGNRIVISRSTRKVGAINTEDGFAGKQLVDKDEEIILAVSVRGGDYLRWPKSFRAMTFRTQHEVARRSKGKPAVPDLAVLFSARLRSPYMAEEITYQRPRPDFPRDVTTHTTTVFVELECAALINRSKNVTLEPIAFGL